MDTGIPRPPLETCQDEEMPSATAQQEECVRKRSGSELSGLTSAELLDANQACETPGPLKSHTCVNAKRIKMPGRRVVKLLQRRTTEPEFEFNGFGAEENGNDKCCRR